MSEEIIFTECIADTETHYLLVIHGTFNAPTPGEIKWYQPGSTDPQNFCHQLEMQLEKLGLPDAVWRSFNTDDAFHWSGANDHNERLSAAERLANTFEQIVLKDSTARIHVVAHSHGGNVVLRSMELYRTRLRVQVTSFLYEFNKCAVNMCNSTSVQDVLNAMPTEISKFVTPKIHAHLPDFLDKIRSEKNRKYAISAPLLLKWTLFIRRVFGTIAEDRKTIVEEWLSVSGWNRFGRVVFLGTPFMRKQWIGSPDRWLRLLDRFIRNFPSVPGFLFGVYVLLLIYSGILSLIPGIHFIGINPIYWSRWLQFFLGLILLAGGCSELNTESRYNTNVYFDEMNLNNATLPEAIPSLVVSAQFLDEALLALSSESIVEAHIVPRIDELLRPERDWAIHGEIKNFFSKFWFMSCDPVENNSAKPVSPKQKTTIGLKTDSNSVFYWTLTSKFFKSIFIIAYYLNLVPWALFRKIVAWPLLNRTISEATTAAAFGLPACEVSNARIEVSCHIGVPMIFKETFHDVSLIAVQTPPFRTDTPTGDKRYDYLFNNDAFEHRLGREESTKMSTWLSVKEKLPDLYSRYVKSFTFEKEGSNQVQPVTFTTYEIALARIWFTLIERIREASGAIELVHSTYYSNPTVINAIANFIVTGSPYAIEPNSPVIDDD